MDLFEEIVRMRRAGRRGALATIVHTNGSIPSYESSRMLVRDDGTIAGTVGGGCVEAEVWAAAKDVIQSEQPRKMTFNLNHEAAYDAVSPFAGGTLEIFARFNPSAATLYLRSWPRFHSLPPDGGPAGFAIGIIDDREAFANAERFPMASEIYSIYEEAFAKIFARIISGLPADQCHAWSQGRYARARLGHRYRRALHRHDRQQTESNFRLQSARERRTRSREASNASTPWSASTFIAPAPE